jgi:MoxR-like ATPase
VTAASIVRYGEPVGPPYLASQPAPQAALGRLVTAVESVVHGRDRVVRLAVSVLLSGGHLLVEDVPGSGKTTLARALAQALGGSFRRIQGTADLMASDITGSAVWEPDTRRFGFVPGPVFANVVLVDELNRTPPRTQSALLEAMDEGAVTVDGVRHPLPDPFALLATQNPLDQWGTYPLPEGQLDRFTALLHLGENTPDVERRVLREQLAGPTVDRLTAALDVTEWALLRAAARDLHVDEAILDYVVALAATSRRHPRVAIGASTRAALSLLRVAQAGALLDGRDHVRPDDVKALAVPVLAHRIVPAAADAGREDGAAIVAEVLDRTAAPPARR